MNQQEEEKKEEKGTPFNDFLQSKLLDTRTVLIYGEINQELAEKVSKQLLLLQAISNDPITIFINSQGGHVEAGDTIHDMIQFITPEVRVIGTGWVASAGVTIYLAAKKENRYSLPNTRYMIHQAAGGVQGQVSDIEVESREMLRMHKRLTQLISDATGQTYDKVEHDIDRNYWMTNEEAVAYGMVSKVISSYTELA